MSQTCGDTTDKFLGCTLPPDPKLTAAGWQRRFIGDARMTRDAVDTYTAMGYEVKLEPVDIDGMDDKCSGCRTVFQHFSFVYTRRIK